MGLLLCKHCHKKRPGKNKYKLLKENDEIKYPFRSLPVDVILLITQRWFSFFAKECEFIDKSNSICFSEHHNKIKGWSWGGPVNSRIKIGFFDWFGRFIHDKSNLIKLFRHVHYYYESNFGIATQYRKYYPKHVYFKNIPFWNIGLWPDRKFVDFGEDVIVLVTSNPEYGSCSKTKVIPKKLVCGPLYAKIKIPLYSKQLVHKKSKEFIEKHWNSFGKHFKNKWFHFWIDKLNGNEIPRIHFGRHVPAYSIKSFGSIQSVVYMEQDEDDIDFGSISI